MLCGREILQDEPLWNVKKAYIEVPRGYLNWLDHTLCLYTGAYCLILNISECGPTPPPKQRPQIQNPLCRKLFCFALFLLVQSMPSSKFCEIIWKFVDLEFTNPVGIFLYILSSEANNLIFESLGFLID